MRRGFVNFPKFFAHLALLAALVPAVALARPRQPPPAVALPPPKPAPSEPDVSTSQVAESNPDDPHVSVHASELPLTMVLGAVTRPLRLAVVCDPDVKSEAIVSANVDNVRLSSALAVILTPMGYSFSIDRAASLLHVFVYDNRTFKVLSPAVIQNWDTSISNEVSGAGASAGMAGGSGASGGSQGSTPGGGQTNTAGGGGGLGARVMLHTRSDATGIWEEVQGSLKNLLGEKGQFTINRVAGFVTVRTTPALMEAVAGYFDALNSEMSRSVVVETKVIEVELNTNRAAGIDWNLVTERINALGSAFVSGMMAPSTLLSGTPFSNTPGVLQLGGAPGQIFIRALEEQGTLKVVAQPTLVLGNNLPAIIEVGTNYSYVSSEQTTVASLGLSQTSVSTSSLMDGLVLSVLPRVSDTKEVTLALGVVLQDLISLNQVTFSGGFIDLPTTSRRSYNGVVKASIGESLVIGGLVENRKQKNSSGIPFLSSIPIIGWIFGAHQIQDSHSELVIIVSPRAVRSGSTLESQGIHEEPL